MRQYQILTNLKSNPNDEFYTPLKTVEYIFKKFPKPIFSGKIVYCPADNPNWSQFAFYLMREFDNLKLKQLIISYHSPYFTQGSLFEQNSAERPKVTIINRGIIANADIPQNELLCKLLELPENKQYFANCNMSLLSAEALEILRSCDIVASNPPFSLLSKYYRKIKEYGKDYILIMPALNASRHLPFDNISIFGICRSFYTPQGKIHSPSCVCANSFNISEEKELNWNYSAKYKKAYNANVFICDSRNDINPDFKGFLHIPTSAMMIYRQLVNSGKFRFVCFSNAVYSAELKRLLELKKIEPEGGERKCGCIQRNAGENLFKGYVFAVNMPELELPDINRSLLSLQNCN